MTGFIITMIVLIVLIVICVAGLVWQIMNLVDATEQFLVPKRKPLKPSRRSLRARVADAWHYWRSGMSLSNAWERASRVI